MLEPRNCGASGCFFLTSSPKLRGKIPNSQKNFKNGDGKGVQAGHLSLWPLRKPCPRSPPAWSRLHRPPSGRPLPETPAGREHTGRRRPGERTPPARPARERPPPPGRAPSRGRSSRRLPERQSRASPTRAPTGGGPAAQWPPRPSLRRPRRSPRGWWGGRRGARAAPTARTAPGAASHGRPGLTSLSLPLPSFRERGRARAGPGPCRRGVAAGGGGAAGQPARCPPGDSGGWRGVMLCQVTAGCRVTARPRAVPWRCPQGWGLACLRSRKVQAPLFALAVPLPHPCRPPRNRRARRAQLLKKRAKFRYFWDTYTASFQNFKKLNWYVVWCHAAT